MLRLESLETRAVFDAHLPLAACLADNADNNPAPLVGPHLAGHEPTHVVFAPDTAPEIMAAYEDLAHQEGFDFFNFGDGSRWNRTSRSGSGLGQGDATIVTWSIAPDGTPIGSFNGEPGGPNNLRSFLAGIYGSHPTSNRAEDQPWFTPLQQVFDRWTEVSGVTYVYEPNDDGAAFGSSTPGIVGVRGDVRIGGHYIDGPSNVLAYNFYPTVGEMVIDTGDSFYFNTGGNSLRLRNTVAHEAGHGLGLGHVDPRNGTKLMEPSITLGFDGPQHDDILAINRGYGDRLEKNGGNDTYTRATDLGTLGLGTFTIDTVSIDDDSDVDWFRFTVGAGREIDLTLTPIGSTYNSNGTMFNSLAQSNLALAVYASNGTTLLASANIHGAGVAETLNNLVLPGSGTYYVRITGSANAAQMYRLTGTIDSAVPEPDVAVFDGTTLISDNSGVVDFGSTLVGSPVTKTFTVQNTGLLNVQLTTPITLPSGFTLVNGFDRTTLAPGQSTTFTVRMEAGALASRSGTLSFGSNDPDENPYNFTLRGEVVSYQLIDDSHAGFSTSGPWVNHNGLGYGGQIRYDLNPRTGNALARWTFDVTPGTYRVAATWHTQGNLATDAPYTISSDGVTLGSVRVNQRAGANDFTGNGVAWEYLGDTFVVTGSKLTVELTNHANGYVFADAIRLEKVGEAPPPVGPEIDVRLGTTPLADGTGVVDFGSTEAGTSVTRTITIKNEGDAPLVLGSTVTLPAGYSLVNSWNGATLAPGQSVALAIRLNATSAGDYNGTLQIVSNDADEGTYDLLLRGAVNEQPPPPPPPVVSIIDNGAAGFSTTGPWIPYGGLGYQGNIAYDANPSSGNATASWTFQVQPGVYRVAATWAGQWNLATNAQYTIRDNGVVRATAQVNQRSGPNDFTSDGATWENLGGNIVVTGNTLTVTLANNGNGYVFADAVRIERVGEPPSGPEVNLFEGVTPLADGTGAVNFGSTSTGTPLTKTFTVRNDGFDPLVLQPNISLPAGYSLVAGFGATTLAAGESTTFRVRLDAASAGTYGGTLTFRSNDADEGEYTITLQGTVADVPPPPVVQILDDGSPGFTTSGPWIRHPGLGLGGDILYDANQTRGDATARWTFQVEPGVYRVAATWHQQWNLATRATYRVLDGSTTLGTAQLNQRAGADDFVDQGVAWEDFGRTFVVTGGTLTIELSNVADAYVFADAIRIEKVG